MFDHWLMSTNSSHLITWIMLSIYWESFDTCELRVVRRVFLRLLQVKKPNIDKIVTGKIMEKTRLRYVTVMLKSELGMHKLRNEILFEYIAWGIPAPIQMTVHAQMRRRARFNVISSRRRAERLVIKYRSIEERHKQVRYIWIGTARMYRANLQIVIFLEAIS